MIWVSIYSKLYNLIFSEGLELARQRQSDADSEVICGCIRRRKVKRNQSDILLDILLEQGVEKNTRPLHKKEYGLQQFENDLKKRRLKNNRN